MANLTNPGNYQLTTMGQTGSVYHKQGSTNPLVAPEGKAFVAITMVTNTTFKTKVTTSGSETDGGLVAENPAECFGTSGKGLISSEAASEVAVGLTFPAGLTIYGRWKSIHAQTGDVVAYLA